MSSTVDSLLTPTSLPSSEPATTTYGRCRHIRWLLPDDVVRTLACSIVTIRLDYCNSLMNNSSNQNLAKLQRVQNSLAHVVLQVPRHTRHSSVAVTTLASNRSAYNFQTQFHHRKCKENINVIISSQSAERSAHVINATRSSRQPLLAILR